MVVANWCAVKDVLESNIAYSAIAQKLIPPLAAGSDIMVCRSASPFSQHI